MADTLCLFTKIKNISGGTLVCSFLPPHGATLAANADYSVFGDLMSLFQTPSGIVDLRRKAAFEAALKAGQLAIISLPMPMFYDATLTKTSGIKIDNGTVTIVNECYGSYTGSP